MKKYLGIFAIVFGVFLPSFVSAQTNGNDSVNQVDCAVITHDLKLGSRNANTG